MEQSNMEKRLPVQTLVTHIDKLQSGDEPSPSFETQMSIDPKIEELCSNYGECRTSDLTIKPAKPGMGNCDVMKWKPQSSDTKEANISIPISTRIMPEDGSDHDGDILPLAPDHSWTDTPAEDANEEKQSNDQECYSLPTAISSSEDPTSPVVEAQHSPSSSSVITGMSGGVAVDSTIIGKEEICQDNKSEIRDSVVKIQQEVGDNEAAGMTGGEAQEDPISPVEEEEHSTSSSSVIAGMSGGMAVDSTIIGKEEICRDNKSEIKDSVVKIQQEAGDNTATGMTGGEAHGSTVIGERVVVEGNTQTIEGSHVDITGGASALQKPLILPISGGGDSGGGGGINLQNSTIIIGGGSGGAETGDGDVGRIQKVEENAAVGGGVPFGAPHAVPGGVPIGPPHAVPGAVPIGTIYAVPGARPVGRPYVAKKSGVEYVLKEAKDTFKTLGKDLGLLKKKMNSEISPFLSHHDSSQMAALYAAMNAAEYTYNY